MVRKLRAFQGPWSQLSDAETFSLLLVGVPRATTGRRLELLVLKEEFFPQLNSLKCSIQILTEAARELLGCEELHIVLRLVLRTGNYMNTGGYAGHAAGFRLASLLRLADTRATSQAWTCCTSWPWRLSGRTRACWISRANWSTWGWHHGSRSRRWHRSCRAWVSPWRGPAAASWSWARSRLHESCCARPRPRCATSSARPRRRSACRCLPPEPPCAPRTPVPLECRTPLGGASGLPCKRTMQAEQRRQEKRRNRHVLRPGAGAGCPVHTHTPAVPPEPHPPGPPPKHWALCQPGLWGRGLP
ncbi:unnamed protein product [Lepidochelys olivacea]